MTSASRRTRSPSISAGKRTPRRPSVGGLSAGNTKDSVAIAGVVLSRASKTLFSRAGATKADLASYFEAVSARMLPHVAGHALSLLRCPNSEANGCFWQKHPSGSEPEGLRSVVMAGDEGEKAAMVVDDARGLVGLAQLGVLEVHVWGSKIDRPDHPDRLVLDLDPGAGVEFKSVVAAARIVRAALAKASLTAFPLVTGSRGIHVVVPLDRRRTFAEVRSYSRALAEALAQAHPQRFVSRSGEKNRVGRIFVDYLRNGRGATAIAPWSPRAKPDASVAVPVTWEELGRIRSSNAWTLTTAVTRARRRADAWVGYARAAGSVPRGA